MNRPPSRCLLIFLALSAFADDARAVATTDRSDDALTAENNEYLPAHPTARPARWAATDLPMPVAAAGSLMPASCPARESAPASRRQDTGGARPLLYLFMSLRR